MEDGPVGPHPDDPSSGVEFDPIATFVKVVMVPAADWDQDLLVGFPEVPPEDHMMDVALGVRRPAVGTHTGGMHRRQTMSLAFRGRSGATTHVLYDSVGVHDSGEDVGVARQAPHRLDIQGDPVDRLTQNTVGVEDSVPGESGTVLVGQLHGSFAGCNEDLTTQMIPVDVHDDLGPTR